MHDQEDSEMSYARSMEEAKAAIKEIEPHNEANMKGSPVLDGQDMGGPEGKGDLVPKNYTLGSRETGSKRSA
jgi:hypothetical protein